MIQIIDKTDRAGREQLLLRLHRRAVAVDRDLLALVSNIIDDVRKGGDQALIEYAARLDGVQLTPAQLRVSPTTLTHFSEQVDPHVLSTLREAIANIRAFHERQKEESWSMTPAEGIRLGQRITPIARVGLYVPGGTAAYPSSVLMNVVPAQIAGVERIVIATPPGTVERNPVVAAALIELGATEVYAVGGAQAIAALAYGTETIPRVDKITGPGNKYVAAAKKLVFGNVGIDSIAGPTEVVIIADDAARPDFIAADLLAQAEHGEDASSVLFTTSESLAQEVALEVERQLDNLPRQEIMRESLTNYGAIAVCSDVAEACELVNRLAPEHVELMTRENEVVAESIRHAGAIFVGPYSPEALGDYFAGPNHVLPTGGSARFSSALGVYDFVKRTSLVSYSREAMQKVANKIAVLADAEGLQGHAQSALIRSDSRAKATSNGFQAHSKSI